MGTRLGSQVVAAATATAAAVTAVAAPTSLPIALAWELLSAVAGWTAATTTEIWSETQRSSAARRFRA